MGDALRLAQQGFKVIPLYTVVDGSCDCGKTPCPNKPGKHPRITAWEKRASDKLPDVLRWWKEWPWANIGVVCGASGAVVVDVDPRNGGIETVDAWVEEHGELPAGPKAITGSGGFHYYFAHPAGAETRGRSDHGFIGNRTAMRPGIDIKADGGQVVAPSSVYETGVMYRWADGCGPELELPPLPHWLREMILEQKTEDMTRPAYALPEGPIKVGRRREELLKWAGFMRQKGASESIIFASLMAVANERAVQSATDPLLPEEIAELAADAARRWQPGEAFVYTKSSEPEPPKRDIRPYTLAELETMEFPPPKWAIPGLLPEGLCLLAGPIKLGKSFLVLGIAIGIAEGDVVLDWDSVLEGDVLYIALEDGRQRMKTRAQKIHPDGGWPSRIEVFDLNHQMPRMDEGGLEVIDAWLGQRPEARLVVIDTLQRFRSKKGSTKGMYAADVDEIEPLQQMAIRHGVAVVVVHHYNKAFHEDWIDAISGSSGVGGTADTIWGVERPRGKKGQKDGRLRITGRDVEEQDFSMSLEDYHWKITGEREEQETSGESPAIQELVSYMERRPWETYGIAEIQNALVKPTYDAAKQLVYRAVAAGSIRKGGRGLFRLPTEAEKQGVGEYPSRSFVPFVSENGTFESTGGDVPSSSFESERNTGTTPPKGTEQNTEHSPSASSFTSRSKPERPCVSCNQSAWTLRIGGVWMCELCRPAVTPSVEEGV